MQSNIEKIILDKMPPQHGVNRRCDCKKRTFLQRNPALRSSLWPCADAQTSSQPDQARIPYPRYAAAQACILVSRDSSAAWSEPTLRLQAENIPPAVTASRALWTFHRDPALQAVHAHAQTSKHAFNLIRRAFHILATQQRKCAFTCRRQYQRKICKQWRCRTESKK